MGIDGPKIPPPRLQLQQGAHKFTPGTRKNGAKSSAHPPAIKPNEVSAVKTLSDKAADILDLSASIPRSFLPLSASNKLLFLPCEETKKAKLTPAKKLQQKPRYIRYFSSLFSYYISFLSAAKPSFSCRARLSTQTYLLRKRIIIGVL